MIAGIILGLSIARLLNGVAGFVQHPARERIWWIHSGRVGWMVLSVIGFWWWEFRLAGVTHWTFEAYVFVLACASVFFLLCTTWLKGPGHLRTLGLEYPARIVVSLALCIAAIRVEHVRFHGALVVLA